MPKSVYSDEKRLRQVLLNLLSNAVKYTKKGKVTFTVRSEKVKEALNIYRITFSIEDTGIGIPKDQFESIFKPFERSKNTRTAFEGTGLGLSVSSRILNELKSEIKINSQVGKGSKFWFTVDLEGTNQEVKDKTYYSENSIKGLKGKSKKILIVDDRWENRTLLTSLLEPLGFDVAEADNGKEALNILDGTNGLPDLIISDIAMPEIDGFKLLEKLKANTRYSSIPVVISSASVFDKDRLNSLQAGAVAFIPKPINYDDLLSCVRDLLSVEWNYESDQEDS
jgi:CheY-like chemotaxis protein/anti-sigma regulatory factor (Ser/Thr protein kinase)